MAKKRNRILVKGEGEGRGGPNQNKVAYLRDRVLTTLKYRHLCLSLDDWSPARR